MRFPWQKKPVPDVEIVMVETVSGERTPETLRIPLLAPYEANVRVDSCTFTLHGTEALRRLCPLEKRMVEDALTAHYRKLIHDVVWHDAR